MKFLTKKKIITAVAVLATFFGGSNYYYETKLKTKDIYLETEYPSINVGDEIELNYIVEPDTASNQEADIIVSNGKILEKIDDNKFKAVKEGNCNITLMQEDKEYHSYSIQVNVVKMESIAFNQKSLSVTLDNTVEPKISYSPKNTTYPKWTFKSNNEEIVQVKNNQLLGKAEGTTTVSVISDGGLRDTVEITVLPIVANSISFKYPSSIRIGDKVQFTSVFEPQNVTHKEVFWSSADSSIATIDAEGNLVAKKDGKVKIKINETSNNKSYEKEITILPIEIEKITLSVPYTSLYVGNGMNASVKYEPNNATYKKVTYSSSNESILKVNENGYITAVAEGEATITAKTENNLKDSVTISVKKYVAPKSYATAGIAGGLAAGGSWSEGSGSSGGGGQMVWISGSGTKYHSRSSCSNMKNPWQVTVEEAQAQGRQPCKKCY